MEAATIVKQMTLLDYVKNWMTDSWDWDYSSQEECALDLIKKNKKECMAKFEKLSLTLCEDKNRMNQGLWEFISFENEIFTYSITK